MVCFIVILIVQASLKVSSNQKNMSEAQVPSLIPLLQPNGLIPLQHIASIPVIINNVNSVSGISFGWSSIAPDNLFYLAEVAITGTVTRIVLRNNPGYYTWLATVTVTNPGATTATTVSLQNADSTPGNYSIDAVVTFGTGATQGYVNLVGLYHG